MEAAALERILLGTSRAMRELRRQLRALAEAPLRSVLVVGETGVGKDLVPRALAACSPYVRGGMEVFNCPAVPVDHLESELFGTVRGAYPGALDRAGAVERAGGGLLFLDEIGAMPLAHQAKVLRFLETGEARRLGATRGYCAAVAVVSATNEDLGAAVETGRFRADLYYRLVQDAVVSVPPLRERLEDVPVLARAFLAALRRGPGIGEAAVARLCRHAWPGNVRELRAVVTGAARLAAGPTLGAADVEAALARIEVPRAAPARAGGEPPRAVPAASRSDSTGPRPGEPRDSFYAATASLQRGLLVDALERAGGNQTLAGVLLGLHGGRGGEGAIDLRARKLAHRKFCYWWARRVEGSSGASASHAASAARGALASRRPLAARASVRSAGTVDSHRNDT